MTYRELAAYVQGLSPHARTRTALRDGRQEPNGEEILLADLFDMLQRLNWTLEAVNAEKKPPKPPKPYTRWWLAPKGEKSRDNSQRLARLEDARLRAAERKRQIEQGAIA